MAIRGIRRLHRAGRQTGSGGVAFSYSVKPSKRLEARRYDHSILSYLIVALRSLIHCASPLILKQTTWVGLAFTVTLVPGSISFVEPWLLWIFRPDGRRT